MSLVQEFYNRIAETHSGRTEVQDFVLKTSYAFPSADVLLPAPMAVSVLGQLTLVATTTDFKLVRPTDGFKHVRYPDSFRATITQLVNSGALALNRSFVNFDEINKRCAAIRPGVNNIVQLLVGHPDNTSRQNEQAIEKYLPGQIQSLSRTVQACLEKTKETDRVFNQLLELTMEIHEACTATQGRTEGRLREANLRKAFLAKEQEAVEEMKRIGEEATKKAHEDYNNAQKLFHQAVDSMPSAGKIAGLNLLDMFQGVMSAVTFGAVRRPGAPSGSTAPSSQPSAPSRAAAHDPGYQKASMLRKLAESLHILLTSGTNGAPNWNAVKAADGTGCTDIRVQFEEVLASINRSDPQRGRTTVKAAELTQHGIEQLEDVVPPGDETQLARLTGSVSAWRDSVLAFASEADLKVASSPITSGVQAFIPAPNTSGGSSAELAVRSAQYNLAVTSAQLNASRENSRLASEKLMQVTGQLGEIMGQICKVDLQKQNWEEIMAILLKAIDFLCELKRYLNNLVHFFNSVHNLVCISMKEAADEFINMVKDASMIEDTPTYGRRTPRIGGITLDAWARQMYVTLYDSNVHPGVNMLLGMGKLVGSNNQNAIMAASVEIQDWAQGASDRIVQLVTELMTFIPLQRAHANERDIERRMIELEKSLGSLLPRSSKIEEIVRTAEKEEVRETEQALRASVQENPVYHRMNPFL
uniref:Non-specific serine/threonine protein kinase (EC) n=1 Tax=Ganoderma boninense TaxID=34458 RepID=A0A5K1JYY5_9APHY|nr:Non-specific serine/threonine protein kinase (EC [Ganoderma boninense]